MTLKCHLLKGISSYSELLGSCSDITWKLLSCCLAVVKQLLRKWSVDQRVANLLAFDNGGLRKKSATWPQPYLNQSARIRDRPGSNHSQSLMASNFAAL